MNRPLHIQLFSTLRVQQDERVITRFRTQQTGALLAYLASHLHQSHPREVLIELFWPGSDIEAGRHNLSNALSSLRSQLEPHGVPGGTVLVADRLVVALNPEATTTDVAEFESGLRRAAQSRTTPHYSRLLAEAVDRYTGLLLPHHYEAWIAPAQERLQQRFQEAVGQLVPLLHREGSFERALDYAHRGIALAPWREEAHLVLIRLLATAGRQEEALCRFQELERLLREEFGAAPSAAAQQIARQIQAQEPAQAAPTLASATPARLPKPLPLAVPALPTGTVTFLTCDLDIAGALPESLGEGGGATQATYRALLRAEFRRNGGLEADTTDDSFLVAFAGASDALSCVLACRTALAAQPWPEAGEVPHPRMALHTGDAELEEGNYQGRTPSHTRRILTSAHAGQTLTSEATAAILRHDLTPGVHLRDLGIWRLTEADEPERLFQIDGSQREHREFPPLHAVPAHTARLPLQFTRFFGRQAEIARIAELLHAPDTRLLTLTGSGGSGKTRLAIEAADTMAERLQGRIWFVPLADLSDPALITGAIVDAMGIPRNAALDPLDQAAADLAKQPALLLLDNFEQLVEGGSDIVQDLLERVRSLTILVTSRRRLDLPGEQEFAVDPLPTPNGIDTPQQLSLFASVQLFVDRAQTSRPDFRITNSNAAAVAELCDRLEGLPLAIELAAARAIALTPAQMLAQLGRRFEFLVSRKRGIADRQRTLRATADWSYRLLSPDLQRFFTQLSVFRGGWTAGAAEAICEEPLALDLLAQLRECSLILIEAGDTEMRFRMLETLREFGDAQLSVEERAALHQRHLDYYVQWAETEEPKFWGQEQAHVPALWEQEYDNLRAAMAWCRTQGEAGVGTGFRLIWAVFEFWQRRGQQSEGQEWMNAILDACSGEAFKADRARGLNLIGAFAFMQGDYRCARTYYEQSLTLWRELGGEVGKADPLSNLALLAHLQNDYALAQELYAERLALYRASGNRLRAATMVLNLGIVAVAQGDHTAARAYYEEALAIRRELGNSRRAAGLLGELGRLAIALGDIDTGRAYHEANLASHQESGHRAGIAAVLDELGGIAVTQGDYETGRTHYEAALAINREVGYRAWEAYNLTNLGTLAVLQGDYAAAQTLYTESLAIRREFGDRVGIATVLEGFAELAAAQRHAAHAVRLTAAAQHLREQIGAPLPPNEQTASEHQQAAHRQALGETAFTAAQTEGRTLPWEQIVTSALEESAEAPDTPG